MDAEPPSPKLSRVVLADDHPLVRDMLKGVLSQEPDLLVVGEAQDGREALDLCRRLRPDIVLMDVRMPKMDGIEATRLIKREAPGIVVLVLTASETPEHLLEALRAGAAGYLLKHSPPSQIRDAVRGVVKGESPLDDEMSMLLLTRLVDETSNEGSSARDLSEGRLENREADAVLPEPLTAREVEVLRLIARGQTNPQIAQTLSVAVTTVKNHVHRIIAKMGVSDRTQAAVRAVELGLIAEDDEE